MQKLPYLLCKDIRVLSQLVELFLHIEHSCHKLLSRRVLEVLHARLFQIILQQLDESFYRSEMSDHRTVVTPGHDRDLTYMTDRRDGRTDRLTLHIMHTYVRVRFWRVTMSASNTTRLIGLPCVWRKVIWRQGARPSFAAAAWSAFQSATRMEKDKRSVCLLSVNSSSSLTSILACQNLPDEG